jgi:thiol-disulfide isomerase/thioredoxin
MKVGRGAVVTGRIRVGGRLLSGLVALVFVVSACTSAGGGSGGASADGTPAPGGGPDGADTALDFHGPTVDGQEFDGAALAGTPVVLWFWAPWCTICRAEAPDVAAVAAE